MLCFSRLVFSSGSCDPSIAYNKSSLGIQETQWLDDITLQVKAHVNINCGERIESGDFKITGNKIILIYKYKSS